MSTWPKAKVLNKYPTELDQGGVIGEIYRMAFYSTECPRFKISGRRSICCENFMSTWPRAKVLNKYPTKLDQRGEIGEIYKMAFYSLKSDRFAFERGGVTRTNSLYTPQFAALSNASTSPPSPPGA